MNIVSDDLNEFLSSADGDQGGTQETGGQLRAKLEKAVSLLKAAQQENETLKSKDAERTVADTWDELKVPEAVRKFYTGDKSADAIKLWWEESKGFFNIPEGEQPAPQAPATETPEQKALREQYQGVQQASALGSDQGHTGLEAAFAKAAEVRTKSQTGTATQADLDALASAMGIPKY